MVNDEVLFMPYIGIDFGTSNSVVANFHYGQAEVVPNHEGQKWTPSVVTMRRDGTLAFGQEAKENFDEQRSIRSIKRILGTPERVPLVGQNLRTEQIAVMLFSLLKKDAEQALNESFTNAVVTIPANSKGLARHATKLCAGAAGLKVLTLINEPTAAAITYGLNASEDQTVLVYDFGGGTLDVTVLRIHHGIFEEISSKGIGKLGGDDIDTALAKVIAERFEQKTGFDILHSPYKQQFMLAVEKAKIDLSTDQTAIARKAALVPERQLSLEEEIDRAQFERIIMPLVVKSGEAIDEALKLRGMRPKDIDKVLLVGGTSKIPLIQRYVSEKLAGKEPEPFDRVDPMTCVAQGAAIVSAILQGAPGLDNYAYSVKLEHSLCANPINEQRKVYLDPIIKRGSDIPCSYSKTYYPVADPAERVLISVFEGDVYDNPDSPENVKLAEIPWEFKPPRTQRDGALDVTFEYGDDGILTVVIHDTHAGQKKRFAIQQSGEDQLDASQLIKMKRINEELVNRTADFESTPEYRDALEVLKKTEQDVIPKVDNAEDRRELEDLCRQVRIAMGSGDRQKMEEAAATLNDRLLNYAYLL
jgi:molecular chaperone DnaK